MSWHTLGILCVLWNVCNFAPQQPARSRKLNLRYLLMVTPTTCRLNKTLENRQPEGLDILKFKPWICITTKNTETNKIYWFYNISSLFFFYILNSTRPTLPFFSSIGHPLFFQKFLKFPLRQLSTEPSPGVLSVWG